MRGARITNSPEGLSRSSTLVRGPCSRNIENHADRVGAHRSQSSGLGASAHPSRHTWRKATEKKDVGADEENTKGVSGTVPAFSVPIWMSDRTYQSVRYQCWRCTELSGLSGTGTKVCTGIAGTGIDVVPNLPVPVLISYRTYRSFQCRY